MKIKSFEQWNFYKQIILYFQKNNIFIYNKIGISLVYINHHYIYNSIYILIF